MTKNSSKTANKKMKKKEPIKFFAANFWCDTKSL